MKFGAAFYHSGMQGIGRLFGPGTTTTTAIEYVNDWFAAQNSA